MFESRLHISHHKVWERIKPAIPDCIESTREGRFIAKWWKPYPTTDIEIILHTEGIYIHGEPYEPDDLAGGIAVRFSLLEA